MALSSKLISRLIDSVVGHWTEAKADKIKRTTPLYYWCQPFKNFAFPPQQFYTLVEEHLEGWQVPELLQERILLSEGTFLSKQRLYLQMRRERIVFEICAAPFGTGYFVSSRLFDRRREARWWDYLIASAIVFSISAGLWIAYGSTVGLIVFGTLIATFWSLMRLAALTNFAWFDEKLCALPWFGPIYETLFHPNTYFRQDQTNMYREAVHQAVIESVAAIRAEKGLRPLTEVESRPILADLNRR